MPVSKLAKYFWDDPSPGCLSFYCPGCNEHHIVPFAHKNLQGHQWNFNGNFEKPSLTPSCNYVGSCHFFLTDGILHFCGDCTHQYAGKSIPLPELSSSL